MRRELADFLDYCPLERRLASPARPTNATSGPASLCIDEGFYGNVDLSGCIVQLAIHAPGPYFNDGNWRVAMYGHASATPPQRHLSKPYSWVRRVVSLGIGAP